jgi:hypothetical protein
LPAISESKQGRSTESQGEFQEIKAKLDARRLLAELSQSHGVIPDKYEVTKAKDGSDRIKAGTQSERVRTSSPRAEHALEGRGQDLARCYARQRGREPEQEAKREPRRQLWGEFQEQRRTRAAAAHGQWDEQRTRERERRDAIKKEFYAKRSKAQSDRSMKPAERKAAVSWPAWSAWRKKPHCASA